MQGQGINKGIQRYAPFLDFSDKQSYKASLASQIVSEMMKVSGFRFVLTPVSRQGWMSEYRQGDIGQDGDSLA